MRHTKHRAAPRLMLPGDATAEEKVIIAIVICFVRALQCRTSTVKTSSVRVTPSHAWFAAFLASHGAGATLVTEQHFTKCTMYYASFPN